jgi:hypothetical protein
MTTASSIRAENLAGNRALVNGGTRGTGAAVAARLKGQIPAMIQTGPDRSCTSPPAEMLSTGTEKCTAFRKRIVRQ